MFLSGFILEVDLLVDLVPLDEVSAFVVPIVQDQFLVKSVLLLEFSLIIRINEEVAPIAKL